MSCEEYGHTVSACVEVMMKSLVFSATIGVSLLLGLITPTAVAADTTCANFHETGQLLCDTEGFLTYWLNNGGLPVFGYPITGELNMMSPDTGQTYVVQYFERARFEYHPENAGTPYAIELGRFGAEVEDLTYSNPDQIRASVPQETGDYTYFSETGHNVSSRFMAYWTSHGLDLGDPGISYRESLALFGYPISEEFYEVDPDGNVYLVQYFERARLEYHPENSNQPQYLVLGGLFGNIDYQQTKQFGDCKPALAITSGKVPINALNTGGQVLILWDTRLSPNPSWQYNRTYIGPNAVGDEYFVGRDGVSIYSFPVGCEQQALDFDHLIKTPAPVNNDYIGPFKNE